MHRWECPAKLELREVDGLPTLHGHAAVYYDETREEETTYRCHGITERIMPGAFDETLVRGEEVIALLQHDPTQPLARRSCGTLDLRSDGEGLAFHMRLADTTRARDLAEDIKSGNISGTSFGFQVRPGGQEFRGQVRSLTSLFLKEISVVTQPAYQGAKVFARHEIDPEELAEWHMLHKRQRLARVMELGV